MGSVERDSMLGTGLDKLRPRRPQGVDPAGDRQVDADAAELTTHHATVERKVVSGHARAFETYRNVPSDVGERRGVSDHGRRDAVDERGTDVALWLNERVPDIEDLPVERQRDQRDLHDPIGWIDASRLGIDDDDTIGSSSYGSKVTPRRLTKLVHVPPPPLSSRLVRRRCDRCGPSPAQSDRPGTSRSMLRRPTARWRSWMARLAA